MPPCEADAACGVEGVIVLAQSQPTPDAVLAAVAAGQVETGLVPADMLVDARCDKRPGPTGIRGVRLLSNIYSETLQIVVRADLPVRGVADLRGRRVLTGAGDGAARRLADEVLAAGGLKRRDVRPLDMDPAAAVPILLRGDADAAILLVPYPDPTVGQLLESGRYVLLPVDDAAAGRLAALRPALAPAALPAGTYGLLRDVPTLASAVAWIAAPGFDGRLAAGLTAAAWRPANRSLIGQKSELAFTGPAAAFSRAAAPLNAGVAAAVPASAATAPLGCPARS
jgi:TRAP transporter TAXI family solute receptor